MIAATLAQIFIAKLLYSIASDQIGIWNYYYYTVYISHSVSVTVTVYYYSDSLYYMLLHDTSVSTTVHTAFRESISCFSSTS